MKQTKPDRLWILGGSVVALLVVTMAWFFVVSPEFSKVSSLRSQTADAQAQNITMQAKVRSLQTEYAKLPDLQASLTKARTALPTGADLSGFTREIAVDAAETRVGINSITVGSVTVATTASAAAPATKVANPAGALFAIPVTVTAKGASANLLAFAAGLRGQGKRAALVTSTQLSSDPSTKGILLNIQVSVFAAPQSPAELAQLQKLMAGTPN